MTTRDEFDAMMVDVAAEFGRACTIRRAAPGAVDTATMKRGHTFAEQSVKLTRLPEQPRISSGGSDGLEAIDRTYSAREADLAWVPCRGDFVIDPDDAEGFLRCVVEVGTGVDGLEVVIGTSQQRAE